MRSKVAERISESTSDEVKAKVEGYAKYQIEIGRIKDKAEQHLKFNYGNIPHAIDKLKYSIRLYEDKPELPKAKQRVMDYKLMIQYLESKRGSQKQF